LSAYLITKPDPRARLKPCLRCGYSLRNNIEARNCPECGLAVRISLGGDDSLEMSNPAWVRRQQLAVALLLLAHVGGLVAMALVQVAFATREYGWGFAVYRGGWLGPVSWITPASAVLLAVGALLMASAREGRYPDRLAGVRPFLWLGAVPLLGLSAFELLQNARLIRGPWLPGWVHMLAASVTLLAAWGFVYELARRVPARRYMHVVFKLCLTHPTPAIFWIEFPARRWRLLFLRIDPWRLPAWPWTVGTLVYVPWATVMLGYGWVLLRAAAREAERNWVTDP
jgi:hypothetical protein